MSLRPKQVPCACHRFPVNVGSSILLHLLFLPLTAQDAADGLSLTFVTKSAS
jgi:hypothetical protein